MKKDKPKRENRKTPPYSVTEVGALLESMDKKIDQIAEGHVGLDKRLENIEVEVHGNSRRLDHLNLGFNVLNGKVSRLEDAVSFVSKELKETRKELGVKIDDLGHRLAGVESRP